MGRSERPSSEPFTALAAHSHARTVPTHPPLSERPPPADSSGAPIARGPERTEPSRRGSLDGPSAGAFTPPNAFAHERTAPSGRGASEKPPPVDSSVTPVAHVSEHTEPSPVRHSGEPSSAAPSATHVARAHMHSGPSPVEAVKEPPSADASKPSLPSPMGSTAEPLSAEHSREHVPPSPSTSTSTSPPVAPSAQPHAHPGNRTGPVPSTAIHPPVPHADSAPRRPHPFVDAAPSPSTPGTSPTQPPGTRPHETPSPSDTDETSPPPVSIATAHQETPWAPAPAHADAPPTQSPRLGTHQGETPHTFPESSALTDELRDALFAFLLGHHADRYAGLSDDALLGLVQQTLDETPELLLGFFRQHLPRTHLHEHWARVLPESLLARLMSLLAPRVHASMLTTLELLSEAWLDVARAHGLPGPDRASLWRFILELLARHPGALLTLEHVVSRFLRHFAPRLRATPSDAAAPLDLRARLLDRATDLARADASHRLEALLRRRREALLNPRPPTPRPRARPPRPTAPKAGRTAFQLGAESSHASDIAPIYIGNAGLVLTSPFLPHLLREAGLLRIEDGKTFLDAEPATRAVHLLQYLVDGSTSTPEPLLVLNKILCGLPVSTPVPSEIQLTDQERTLCDRLLRALIAHWKIISNTSIAGLRETFLQREGRLEHLEDRWKLQVQRKTLDVLVDQVPWSISILTHPWMPQPLYVSW